MKVVWGSGQNYDGVQLWYLVKNDTTAAQTRRRTPYSGCRRGLDGLR